MHEAVIRKHHQLGNYEQATVALLAAYGRQIRRYIASRCAQAADAQEAYAEFSCDVWRGMAGFQWQCSARAWAYALARRAAIRHMSKSRRRGRYEVLGAGSLSAAEHDAQAALCPQHGSRWRQLKALCQKLADADRKLLQLRVVRGLEWKEIAAAMQQHGAAPLTLDGEAARLRKRFQLIRMRLRRLAEAALPQS